MSDQYSREELVRQAIRGDVGLAVRTAIEEYTDYLIVRNYSVKTIDVRRGHLAEFGSWLHGQGIEAPEDVTRRVLAQYQTWMHSRPLSHGRTRAISTQSQRLTTLRTFFRFLVHSEGIASNPALHLELPRPERPLPTPVLTREEVERVLAQPDTGTVCGMRDRAVMETLFATGIRRNELIQLTIDDVDGERRTLTVRRGKGKRGRMVPISERALGWIHRYLAVRPAPTGEATRVLFLTMRGQMCGSVTLSRTVRGYVEAAGLGKSGSCHIFRATTATLMLESGIDIRFIQEMLGHAKLTTTQIYTRVSIGALHHVYAQSHPSARETPAVPDIACEPAEKDPSRPSYYRWNRVQSDG
jgi:integrase/recombinase XerD